MTLRFFSWHTLYNGGPLVSLVIKGRDFDWPLADFARAEIGNPGHEVKFTTAPDGEETLEVTNLRLASSIAARPAKPRRQRKPNVGTLIKQAEKSGKPVSAAVIGSDGVTLHFGKTEQATDLNPWDEVLPREPH
jgi:hypothetical protein